LILYIASVTNKIILAKVFWLGNYRSAKNKWNIMAFDAGGEMNFLRWAKDEQLE
jgi:hypothetical protein